MSVMDFTWSVSLRGFSGQYFEFLKRYQIRDFNIEYKYILFTNNCQKLDPEIFLQNANFAILIFMLTAQ